MQPITSLPAVQAAIAQFKLLLDPGARSQIALSELYRVRPVATAPKHWPLDYGEVWGNPVGGGVYLHFDEHDRLLYIGKAVCIGSRLANYYKKGSGQACLVHHERLDEEGVIGTRIVKCSGDIQFLAPALEWYLIFHCPTPLNIHGRNWAPPES